MSSKEGEIDVQQIRSCNNLVDLFTNVLPSTTLKKLRYNIRILMIIQGGVLENMKIYRIMGTCG